MKFIKFDDENTYGGAYGIEVPGRKSIILLLYYKIYYFLDILMDDMTNRNLLILHILMKLIYLMVLYLDDLSSCLLEILLPERCFLGNGALLIMIEIICCEILRKIEIYLDNIIKVKNFYMSAVKNSKI